MSDPQDEICGFKVFVLEYGLVGVRHDDGREIVFDWPCGDTKLTEYDQFIEEMMNDSVPVPSEDRIRLAIGKSIGSQILDGTLKPFQARVSNDDATPLTWQRFAEIHRVTVWEMEAIYLFARGKIYNGIRSRLRPKIEDDTPAT